MKARRLGGDSNTFSSYLKSLESPVKSGLPSLDNMLHGFRGIVGFVGEPETCKSTLVLQIALYNASQGIPIYYIDAENGEGLTIERAICNLSGKSWLSLKAEGLDVINKWFKKLQNLPLYYINPPIAFEELHEDVAYLLEKEKHDKCILCIDSFQSLWSLESDIRLTIDGWLHQLELLKLQYKERLVALVTSEKQRSAYGVALRSAPKESGRIEYKLSQQLDLRECGDKIMLACTKNRFGSRGDEIVLAKVKDKNGHFTFRIESASKETVQEITELLCSL